jgi:hypothetical protein
VVDVLIVRQKILPKTNFHMKIRVTIEITISVGSVLKSLFGVIWRTIMNTIDYTSHMLWSTALLGRLSGHASSMRDGVS